MLVASDGAVWFGSTRAGVTRFDPRDDSWVHYRRDAEDGAIGGLSDNRVLALYEDREGRIWSGNINGLNLIDPLHRNVRVLRSDPQDVRSLSANLVRSIHQSADGHLWFGTQSGLNRLDALDDHSARFSRWSLREGLPGATVYAIRDDRMARLWLSTNHGIASFDPSSGTFRGFTLADGLQGMEFNGGAAATLASGEIVFGGVNGLNLFMPQAIVGSRYAAPVVLTSARVGANGIPAHREGDAFVMAAAERVIRFEFAALDFAAPERNLFAYQLEGFDEHWIEAGTRHDATYTNLDAGHYRFKVRASNRDGYWSEHIAQAELRVTPAWWDSLAARTLYALAGASLLLVLWRAQRRRRNEERSHHLDLREREDRLRLALWGSGDDFWDWNMSKGDGVLFYHSSCEVPGVAGIAEVASAAYPDPTQFERKSAYYDEKSTREEPRWMLVDVAFKRKLARTITLAELKEQSRLDGFALLQRGNRLSVLPVSKAQWDCILALE